MGSDHTTTSFGDIDGPTTRFLARIAKNINYLHRDCSPTPTNERFYRDGVETYEVGQLDISGAIVTIYSFDGGRVFNTLQQRTENTPSNSEAEQFFAVDWPIEQENGQSYISFYFKTRPSKEEIKKAHRIHQVKIAIENRKLLQEFRCQHCSERVHWTNLKEDGDMTMEERVIMLEKQLCNCEGSLELLQEGLDDGHIISPSDASVETKESATSSLD